MPQTLSTNSKLMQSSASNGRSKEKDNPKPLRSTASEKLGSLLELLSKSLSCKGIELTNEVLGTGTFSIVLRGTLRSELAEGLGLPVAVKVLHSLYQNVYYKSEIEAMLEVSMIGDENSGKAGVPLLLVNNTKNGVQIVSPMLQGTNFSEFIQWASIDDIRLYMGSLLKDLAASHEARIIHRDVKPKNFVYEAYHRVRTSDGQRKNTINEYPNGFLIDWGLADLEEKITRKYIRSLAKALAKTNAAHHALYNEYKFRKNSDADIISPPKMLHSTANSSQSSLHLDNTHRIHARGRQLSFPTENQYDSMYEHIKGSILRRQRQRSSISEDAPTFSVCDGFAAKQVARQSKDSATDIADSALSFNASSQIARCTHCSNLWRKARDLGATKESCSPWGANAPVVNWTGVSSRRLELSPLIFRSIEEIKDQDALRTTDSGSPITSGKLKPQMKQANMYTKIAADAYETVRKSHIHDELLQQQCCMMLHNVRGKWQELSVALSRLVEFILGLSLLNSYNPNEDPSTSASSKPADHSQDNKLSLLRAQTLSMLQKNYTTSLIAYNAAVSQFLRYVWVSGSSLCLSVLKPRNIFAVGSGSSLFDTGDSFVIASLLAKHATEQNTIAFPREKASSMPVAGGKNYKSDRLHQLASLQNPISPLLGLCFSAFLEIEEMRAKVKSKFAEAVDSSCKETSRIVEQKHPYTRSEKSPSNSSNFPNGTSMRYISPKTEAKNASAVTYESEELNNPRKCDGCIVPHRDMITWLCYRGCSNAPQCECIPQAIASLVETLYPSDAKTCESLTMCLGLPPSPDMLLTMFWDLSGDETVPFFDVEQRSPLEKLATPTGPEFDIGSPGSIPETIGQLSPKIEPLNPRMIQSEDGSIVYIFPHCSLVVPPLQDYLVSFFASTPSVQDNLPWDAQETRSYLAAHCPSTSPSPEEIDSSSSPFSQKSTSRAISPLVNNATSPIAPSNITPKPVRPSLSSSKQKFDPPNIVTRPVSAEDIYRALVAPVPLEPQFGNRSGTPGFRAPEVLFHFALQTSAIDIWSAGVILLCLLTRRYPLFPGRSDEEQLICMLQILSESLREAARDGMGKQITHIPNSTLHTAHEKHSEMHMDRSHLPISDDCPTCIHLANGKPCTHSFWRRSVSIPAALYNLIPKDRMEEPGFPQALHLVLCCLDPHPGTRITAAAALKFHPFFQPLVPWPPIPPSRLMYLHHKQAVAEKEINEKKEAKEEENLATLPVGVKPTMDLTMLSKLNDQNQLSVRDFLHSTSPNLGRAWDVLKSLPVSRESIDISPENYIQCIPRSQIRAEKSEKKTLSDILGKINHIVRTIQSKKDDWRTQGDFSGHHSQAKPKETVISNIYGSNDATKHSTLDSIAQLKQSAQLSSSSHLPDQPNRNTTQDASRLPTINQSEDPAGDSPHILAKDSDSNLIALTPHSIPASSRDSVIPQPSGNQYDSDTDSLGDDMSISSDELVHGEVTPIQDAKLRKAIVYAVPEYAKGNEASTFEQNPGIITDKKSQNSASSFDSLFDNLSDTDHREDEDKDVGLPLYEPKRAYDEEMTVSHRLFHSDEDSDRDGPDVKSSIPRSIVENRSPNSSSRARQAKRSHSHLHRRSSYDFSPSQSVDTSSRRNSHRERESSYSNTPSFRKRPLSLTDPTTTFRTRMSNNPLPQGYQTFSSQRSQGLSTEPSRPKLGTTMHLSSAVPTDVQNTKGTGVHNTSPSAPAHPVLSPHKSKILPSSPPPSRTRSTSPIAALLTSRKNPTLVSGSAPSPQPSPLSPRPFSSPRTPMSNTSPQNASQIVTPLSVPKSNGSPVSPLSPVMHLFLRSIQSPKPGGQIPSQLRASLSSTSASQIVSPSVVKAERSEVRAYSVEGDESRLLQESLISHSPNPHTQENALAKAKAQVAPKPSLGQGTNDLDAIPTMGSSLPLSTLDNLSSTQNSVSGVRATTNLTSSSEALLSDHSSTDPHRSLPKKRGKRSRISKKKLAQASKTFLNQAASKTQSLREFMELMVESDSSYGYESFSSSSSVFANPTEKEKEEAQATTSKDVDATDVVKRITTTVQAMSSTFAKDKFLSILRHGKPRAIVPKRSRTNPLVLDDSYSSTDYEDHRLLPKRITPKPSTYYDRAILPTFMSMQQMLEKSGSDAKKGAFQVAFSDDSSSSDRWFLDEEPIQSARAGGNSKAQGNKDSTNVLHMDAEFKRMEPSERATSSNIPNIGQSIGDNVGSGVDIRKDCTNENEKKNRLSIPGDGTSHGMDQQLPTASSDWKNIALKERTLPTQTDQVLVGSGLLRKIALARMAVERPAVSPPAMKSDAFTATEQKRQDDSAVADPPSSTTKVIPSNPTSNTIAAKEVGEQPRLVLPSSRVANTLSLAEQMAKLANARKRKQGR